MVGNLLLSFSVSASVKVHVKCVYNRRVLVVVGLSAVEYL